MTPIQRYAAALLRLQELAPSVYTPAYIEDALDWSENGGMLLQKTVQALEAEIRERESWKEEPCQSA